MIYHSYKPLDETNNTYLNFLVISFYMLGATILISYCDKLKSKNK